ncbi:ANTAR domain-containing protein [Pelotomaculum terephthalicicum JT]|uniref:ANTAR domain-containing response regulator n=1 Tax=Pelotomaculum TaxID=191373 RepID=UPI0009CBB5F4|nr:MULTISPECIES: ANTAR domain-containing protein [Pelotomaculum]MCG9966732.1 ANTAR domain-containing protein [Pelotomaculum terephthalicicum JT]OPX85579.1 MAG: putative transcriptional regulatory protein pdtaR [Pelotomaculum sp. PtaB.Bin117]OPY61728.1 MAG: putative transcriptional regulatory protein pdtaR [Pelotomaculum sp. PtaU1.Bin065]
MFGARIVIADADVNSRKKLKEILILAGYLVVGEVSEGRSALKVVFQTDPDLVIMDTMLPGAAGLDIIRIIEEHRVAPVILLADSRGRDMLEEVKDSWIFAFLVKPVSDAQLVPAIEIAIANFRKFIKLEEENKGLKQALEERKLVEKAKGLLMEARALSEKEAYKYLQRLSMDNCVPIVRVAKKVIKLYSKKDNKRQ